MAARPRRSLLIVAALAIAGIAAACTPVTPPPPPAQPQPQPQASVASACPGAAIPVPTASNPVDYVAEVDTGTGTTEIETFTATSEAQVDQEIAALETEGTVVSVQEDLPVTTQAVDPDDQRYPEQWGLLATDFDLAWALPTSLPTGHDGAGQVIAIVDTGIDADHPEFSGRVLAGQRFLENDGSPGGSDVEDDHGHGTHVAGIAAAADSPAGAGGYGLGGAPGAQILPVKVLKENGSGASADVAAGIRWAADEDADVINLSLGGGSCATIGNAVNYARGLGVVVVAAAGNSDTNQLSAPGGSPGVITVGASTQGGGRASFSNYGEYVDIGAPGSDIASTFPSPPVRGRPDGFGYLSGTSMSSPFVAAAAALLKQKCPSLTPDQVQSMLETFSGKNVGGLGARLLDVDRALENAC